MSERCPVNHERLLYPDEAAIVPPVSHSATPDERATALRQHISSDPGLVCLFAREMDSDALDFHGIPTEEITQRRMWSRFVEKLAAFWRDSSKRVLLVTPEITPVSHHVAANYAGQFRDAVHHNLPNEVFVFGMSSLYHRLHPRYAPALSIVINRQTDIDQALGEHREKAGMIMAAAQIRALYAYLRECGHDLSLDDVSALCTPHVTQAADGGNLVSLTSSDESRISTQDIAVVARSFDGGTYVTPPSPQ